MSRRVRLFGITLDAITLRDATRCVVAWAAGGSGPCRYVVTPNLAHLVLLREHAGLRAAYADASLVVADGQPLVTGSRLVGRPLPERVAGVDLVMSVLAAADPGLRIFLLGAAPGVAERAGRRIEARWPAVRVVGTASPPEGFEADPRATGAIVEQMQDTPADLLVVGLGCPKQELWLHRHRARLRAGVAIGAGAAIDCLAGQRRRAPVWLQRHGLEWLHRLGAEPVRLAPRYARCAALVPRLLWEEWRAGRR